MPRATGQGKVWYNLQRPRAAKIGNKATWKDICEAGHHRWSVKLVERSDRHLEQKTVVRGQR